MALFDTIINFFKPRGAKPSGTSRYQRLEFSDRFECSLAALSGSGACEGLFLNRYSERDILTLFDHAGITGHLAAKGFSKLRIGIRKDETGVHTLTVHDRHDSPDRLLMDLRLSEMVYTPDKRVTGRLLPKDRYPVIAVEWINLQNPREAFTADRPPLPGQTYPGLGAAKLVLSMLETIGRDASAAAVLDVPESVHAAIMYSRRFIFIEPSRQALLDAIRRDLAGYRLRDISFGFAEGAVRDARTGALVRYEPSEQLMPISEELAGYFSSSEYRAAREEALQRYALVLDSNLLSCER